MNNRLELIESMDALQAFCRANHIRKLSLFGSYVRGDYSPKSDLDILVEFDPGYLPGLDFFWIEADLSKLLNEKVDLQTLNFLSPSIRQYAVSEAVVAYEQA